VLKSETAIAVQCAPNLNRALGNIRPKLQANRDKFIPTFLR